LKIEDLENRGQDMIIGITGFPKSAEENKTKQTEKPVDASILILMTSYVKMICQEPLQPNPQ